MHNHGSPSSPLHKSQLSDHTLPSLKDLPALLEQVMYRDRYRLQRQLQDLQRQPSGDDASQSKAIAQWCQRQQASQQRLQARIEAVPTLNFPDDLPVSAKRDDIADAIASHQVVIVAGETGSGKTTQIPKICLSLGLGVKGMIGHTQPRRLAARTVASRIAEELNSPLGESVGYQVRFTDQVSDKSHIKLMTDGILLAEIQRDRFLNQYDTIIIDEAHERSLNIDFLLGYLKQLLPKRPDLKVIVTSATIDVERFSEHFDNAPVIEVSGRTYPVETLYRPMIDGDDDLYQAIVNAVAEIDTLEKGASRHKGSDILVFLSGERDIREAAKALKHANFPHLEVLPLYARLSLAEQNKVFQSHSGRRIVLSTNVAETSITVPGIRYVIDPGYARLSRYSYRTKIQRLPIEAISQASANQRQGRCGRVAEGVCIRLYSEEDFLSRPEFTDAEIMRTNLAAVILQMLQMRIGDIHQFPFVDKPDRRLINDGYKLLEQLQAVNTKGQLTALGKQLCQLPVDPCLGRMILAAQEQQCVQQLLIIVSALSVQDPRERPAEKRQAADEKHRRFWDDHSDLSSYINLWNYYEELRQELSQNQLRKRCKKEFLSYLRLREWRDIHHQLKLAIKSLNTKKSPKNPSETGLSQVANTEGEGGYEAIHRALLSGLLNNIAFKHEENEYLGARNKKLMIFPGSSQQKKMPKWIVAAELLETSRLFAHGVAKVEPEWILAAAQHLVKRHYFEPHYSTQSGQVMGYEKVTLYGLTLAERQKINYSRIDPVVSREVFIRQALVEGGYSGNANGRGKKGKGEFFARNQRLIAELEELEAKSRRRDVLADEQVLFDFYQERIPADIVNLAGFEYWREKTEAQQPDLLIIDRERLMLHSATDVTEAQFPDTIQLGDVTLPLSYHFEPNTPDDGVNVHVPVNILHQVPAQRLQWLVPGLLRDKCIAWVKALPKQWRKNVVPVPAYVDKALAQLQPDNVDLAEALALQLKREAGVDIPPDAWPDESTLDDFYRMNIRVVDERGRTIDRDRQLDRLREKYRDTVQQSIQDVGSDQERQGITAWDFGALPQTTELKRAGMRIKTYPALVDRGQSVDLKLLDNPMEAGVQNRRGITRLLMLSADQTVKYLRKELLKGKDLGLTVANMGRREEVIDDMIAAAVFQVCFAERELPSQQAEFEQILSDTSQHIVGQANQIESILVESLAQLVGIKKSIKQNKNALAIAYAVADINQQLDRLFGRGCLFDTPFQWLQQYPRYLQAIELRLEKVAGQVQKDKMAIEDLNDAYARYEGLINKEGEWLLHYNPELVTYRWMLEELRVSLFAQTLKTAMPVSLKRLNKQWQAVEAFQITPLK